MGKNGSHRSRVVGPYRHVPTAFLRLSSPPSTHHHRRHRLPCLYHLRCPFLSLSRVSLLFLLPVDRVRQTCPTSLQALKMRYLPYREVQRAACGGILQTASRQPVPRGSRAHRWKRHRSTFHRVHARAGFRSVSLSYLRAACRAEKGSPPDSVYQSVHRPTHRLTLRYA